MQAELGASPQQEEAAKATMDRFFLNVDQVHCCCYSAANYSTSSF